MEKPRNVFITKNISMQQNNKSFLNKNNSNGSYHTYKTEECRGEKEKKSERKKRKKNNSKKRNKSKRRKTKKREKRKKLEQYSRKRQKKLNKKAVSKFRKNCFLYNNCFPTFNKGFYPCNKRYDLYNNNFDPYNNNFNLYKNNFDPYNNIFDPYINKLNPYNNRLNPNNNRFNPYNNNLDPYNNNLDPYNNNLDPYNKENGVVTKHSVTNNDKKTENMGGSWGDDKKFLCRKQHDGTCQKQTDNELTGGQAKNRQSNYKQANYRQANNRQSNYRKANNEQSKDIQVNNEQPINRQANYIRSNNRQSINRRSNDIQVNNEQANNRQPIDRQFNYKRSNNIQSNEMQSNNRQANNRQANNKESNNREANNREANNRQANNRQANNRGVDSRHTHNNNNRMICSMCWNNGGCGCDRGEEKTSNDSDESTDESDGLTNDSKRLTNDSERLTKDSDESKDDYEGCDGGSAKFRDYFEKFKNDFEKFRDDFDGFREECEENEKMRCKEEFDFSNLKKKLMKCLERIRKIEKNEEKNDEKNIICGCCKNFPEDIDCCGNFVDRGRKCSDKSVRFMNNCEKLSGACGCVCGDGGQNESFDFSRLGENVLKCLEKIYQIEEERDEDNKRCCIRETRNNNETERLGRCVCQPVCSNDEAEQPFCTNNLAKPCPCDVSKQPQQPQQPQQASNQGKCGSDHCGLSLFNLNLQDLPPCNFDPVDMSYKSTTNRQLVSAPEANALAVKCSNNGGGCGPRVGGCGCGGGGCCGGGCGCGGCGCGGCCGGGSCVCGGCGGCGCGSCGCGGCGGCDGCSGCCVCGGCGGCCGCGGCGGCCVCGGCGGCCGCGCCGCGGCGGCDSCDGCSPFCGPQLVIKSRPEGAFLDHLLLKMKNFEPKKKNDKKMVEKNEMKNLESSEKKKTEMSRTKTDERKKATSETKLKKIEIGSGVSKKLQFKETEKSTSFEDQRKRPIQNPAKLTQPKKTLNSQQQTKEVELKKNNPRFLGRLVFEGGDVPRKKLNKNLEMLEKELKKDEFFGIGEKNEKTKQKDESLERNFHQRLTVDRIPRKSFFGEKNSNNSFFKSNWPSKKNEYSFYRPEKNSGHVLNGCVPKVEGGLFFNQKPSLKTGEGLIFDEKKRKKLFEKSTMVKKKNSEKEMSFFAENLMKRIRENLSSIEPDGRMKNLPSSVPEASTQKNCFSYKHFSQQPMKNSTEKQNQCLKTGRRFARKYENFTSSNHHSDPNAYYFHPKVASSNSKVSFFSSKQNRLITDQKNGQYFLKAKLSRARERKKNEKKDGMEQIFELLDKKFFNFYKNEKFDGRKTEKNCKRQKKEIGVKLQDRKTRSEDASEKRKNNLVLKAKEKQNFEIQMQNNKNRKKISNTRKTSFYENVLHEHEHQKHEQHKHEHKHEQHKHEPHKHEHHKHEHHKHEHHKHEQHKHEHYKHEHHNDRQKYIEKKNYSEKYNREKKERKNNKRKEKQSEKTKNKSYDSFGKRVEKRSSEQKNILVTKGLLERKKMLQKRILEVDKNMKHCFL